MLLSRGMRLGCRRSLLDGTASAVATNAAFEDLPTLRFRPDRADILFAPDVDDQRIGDADEYLSPMASAAIAKHVERTALAGPKFSSLAFLPTTFVRRRAHSFHATQLKRGRCPAPYFGSTWTAASTNGRTPPFQHGAG